MKRILASILILAATAPVMAQGRFGGCGSPPKAPDGFVYVCMCDARGGNCQFVLMSKR